MEYCSHSPWCDEDVCRCEKYDMYASIDHNKIIRRAIIKTIPVAIITIALGSLIIWALVRHTENQAAAIDYLQANCEIVVTNDTPHYECEN